MLPFSREALRFLSDLAANNDRDWFQPRKGDYDRLLREPALALVARINEKLPAEYHVDPAKAVYRIYRDTRFSKDKTPYKTHIAALWWHRALGKDGGAALYFHASAAETLIAGGLYHARPETLFAVRRHIAEHHERLASILARKRLRQLFGGIEGDSLQRPPKGFSPEHPAIVFLKRKDLLLERKLAATAAARAGFEVELAGSFEELLPFVEFLNEPLVAQARKAKDPLLAASARPYAK